MYTKFTHEEILVARLSAVVLAALALGDELSDAQAEAADRAAGALIERKLKKQQLVDADGQRTGTWFRIDRKVAIPGAKALGVTNAMVLHNARRLADLAVTDAEADAMADAELDIERDDVVHQVLRDARPRRRSGKRGQGTKAKGSRRPTKVRPVAKRTGTVRDGNRRPVEGRTERVRRTVDA